MWDKECMTELAPNKLRAQQSLLLLDLFVQAVEVVRTKGKNPGEPNVPNLVGLLWRLSHTIFGFGSRDPFAIELFGMKLGVIDERIQLDFLQSVVEKLYNDKNRYFYHKRKPPQGRPDKRKDTDSPVKGPKRKKRKLGKGPIKNPPEGVCFYFLAGKCTFDTCKCQHNKAAKKRWRKKCRDAKVNPKDLVASLKRKPKSKRRKGKSGKGQGLRRKRE